MIRKVIRKTGEQRVYQAIERAQEKHCAKSVLSVPVRSGLYASAEEFGARFSINKCVAAVPAPPRISVKPSS